MAELKTLTEKEVEDMLLETGAIMEGHFLPQREGQEYLFGPEAP